MAIIDFDNVSFSYDGETNALEGLTAAVEKGSFVCVLGGNGSGKSTFAKHINALLVPDKGQVHVAGKNTRDPYSTYCIRENAGMVFQNPDDQIVASLVQDDVAFGPENLGVAPTELQHRVKCALEQVGLAGFENQPTHALSGGQKQRVAVAGVMAMEPHILILDEASAMLDPEGRKNLMALVHELNQQGLTVVMITHFMEQAVKADRVLVLAQGKVALEGPPQKVLTNTRALTTLELDAPFPIAVGQALQQQGLRIEATIEQEALVASVKALMKRPCARAINATAPLRAIDRPDAAKCDVRKPALLRFQDVSFTYEPAKRKRRAHGGKRTEDNENSCRWALRHLSLEMLQGEFLAIAGHTGSGKSTLVQLSNGLLQPTSGQVTLNGCDLANKKAAIEARRAVGVVFQYPERQLFAATVADDVAFGPRNLGLDDAEVERRTREALEQVHLSYRELKDKSPFSLSGGQQRRVALAGVLAMEPTTLILDEPMAGLDPQSHDRMLALIKELHRTQGITVAMVSHNMDDIGAVADRVAVLNEGRLFTEGEPLSVFRDPAPLQTIGLGIPRTWELALQLEIQDDFKSIPTIAQLAKAVAAHCHGESSGD